MHLLTGEIENTRGERVRSDFSTCTAHVAEIPVHPMTLLDLVFARIRGRAHILQSRPCLSETSVDEGCQLRCCGAVPRFQARTPADQRISFGEAQEVSDSVAEGAVRRRHGTNICRRC